LLRAKLFREAEKLLEDVEREATTKWMEAQGEGWNGWDHLYRVTAEVQQGDDLLRVLVPISSVTFRIAMKQCRFKVSTLMETKRLEKAEEIKRMRKEQKIRRAALAQVSALPRPEAEKTIERRIEDMMQPLVAKLGSIEEQIKQTLLERIGRIMASHSHERMSSGETGALRDLRTSAERLHSPRTKLASRPTRTPRTSSKELYRKPKQGRESGGDVRRKRRQLPTLLLLQVLPKVEAGQAIPGPQEKASQERGTGAKARQRKFKNRGRISIRESTQAATFWTF
jgi:hypothetical protein